MSAKYYAKRILYGIGKALYLFGKGIWFVLKAFGKAISIAYRNYQERQRREEMLRQHYRGIERENRAAGRGWTRGVADVREEEIIRRQNERNRREALRRFENQMFDVPKVNDDFFVQDLQPKKRKKRRQFFDL